MALWAGAMRAFALARRIAVFALAAADSVRGTPA